MNQQENSANIKDYLLDKSPGEYVKAASPYQVLAQTASDFIVSRKKGRSEKVLAILISEGQFYFREKEMVEEVTPEKLQAFLRDLRGLSIKLDQVLWLRALDKDSIGRLMNVIQSPTYIEMIRAEVLSKEDIFTYHNWRVAYWEKNPELYKNVHESVKARQHLLQAGMEVAFEIEDRFGHDEARYFVEALGKSGIEQFNCSHDRYSYSEKAKGFFQLLDAPYNLELRRLIDYTFTDSYVQGITNINADFWQAYAKYLKMQFQTFGEIRDKHPKYLMAACHIAELNAGMMEHFSSDGDFAEFAAHVSGLAHEGEEYSIVVPSNAWLIAEDGIALNHCVGAAVGQVSSGGQHVLFLRNSGAKDKPLVTLRYMDGKITHAEGLYRRGLNAGERKFLDGWGKQKDIQIAA